MRVFFSSAVFFFVSRAKSRPERLSSLVRAGRGESHGLHASASRVNVLRPLIYNTTNADVRLLVVCVPPSLFPRLSRSLSRKKISVLGPPVFHPQQPMYTVAALPPGAGGGHPHHHNPYEVAALPAAQMQQLVVAQQAEEMRKNAKRAANRRSASTCRQRRKFLVENMADANDRMRKRARVLSLLPDMILAMRRDGVITYASENCSHFLQFTRQVGQNTQNKKNSPRACFFWCSEAKYVCRTRLFVKRNSRAGLFAIRFKLVALRPRGRCASSVRHRRDRVWPGWPVECMSFPFLLVIGGGRHSAFPREESRVVIRIRDAATKNENRSSAPAADACRTST